MRMLRCPHRFEAALLECPRELHRRDRIVCVEHRYPEMHFPPPGLAAGVGTSPNLSPRMRLPRDGSRESRACPALRILQGRRLPMLGVPLQHVLGATAPQATKPRPSCSARTLPTTSGERGTADHFLPARSDLL